MQNLALISSILGIHILAWLTPGPLFVLILRNSLIYSRKTGVWTALGIAIGNLVHITYSVTGIALIISTSSIVFNVVKFLGVGYLTYLGIKTIFIRSKTQNPTHLTENKNISAVQGIKTGFLANILSPKASLFYASIFATVLSLNPPLWVIVFLMITMPLNSFIMASILSTFFAHKKIRSFYSNYQNIINKCLGIILILLAAVITFNS